MIYQDMSSMREDLKGYEKTLYRYSTYGALKSTYTVKAATKNRRSLENLFNASLYRELNRRDINFKRRGY